MVSEFLHARPNYTVLPLIIGAVLLTALSVPDLKISSRISTSTRCRFKFRDPHPSRTTYKTATSFFNTRKVPNPLQISALPREYRGKDVGVFGDYDPWKIDDEVINEDLDDDDDDEITDQDIEWILQGYHPSMSKEDIDQHQEMLIAERAEAKKKEEQKEEKEKAKSDQSKSKKDEEKDELEEDERKKKIPYRYRGVDQYTGKALHPEKIRKGAISDYYEPWMMKPINYTRGWKLGMRTNVPQFRKDPATLAELIEKELGLEGNEIIEEPFTGYKWPMKSNLTWAAARSRRGKPLVERHVEGTLYACTFVKLTKTKYGSRPKKSGEKLQIGEDEEEENRNDGLNLDFSSGESADHIALYVDYEAARDYFVKEGAKLIPLDEESDALPPKTGVARLIERAASWYFNDWPERLNPFPRKIKTEFTRREEAYGQAFLKGKFAKKLVIKFGTTLGMQRWAEIFETMRGECSIQKSPEGGASEAYRFQKMMESFDEAIKMQDDLKDGELILDFDSQNRVTVTLKRGKRFWHLPLEDPFHAYQGVNQDSFRSCELLLGAFFKNHEPPYSHLKAIFLGAAKSIFTKLDTLKPARQYVKKLKNLIDPKEFVLNKDFLEQEQQWEVDYDDRARLPRPFEELVREAEQSLETKPHLKNEMERTGIWDRSKSKAFKSRFQKEEEDPYEVAKKIEAAKKKVKNPFPLPKSVDGGLTYQFTPEMKKKTDVLSIEFQSEMKDNKREMREKLSEYDLDVVTRAFASRLQQYHKDRADDKFKEQYDQAEKKGEEFDFDGLAQGGYLPLQMDPPAFNEKLRDPEDGSIDEGILQLAEMMRAEQTVEVDPVEFYGKLASDELSTSVLIANSAYNKRRNSPAIDMIPVPAGLGFENAAPSMSRGQSASEGNTFVDDFPPLDAGSNSASSLPPELENDFPAMNTDPKPLSEFPPMNTVQQSLITAEMLQQSKPSAKLPTQIPKRSSDSAFLAFQDKSSGDSDAETLDYQKSIRSHKDGSADFNHASGSSEMDDPGTTESNLADDNERTDTIENSPMANREGNSIDASRKEQVDFGLDTLRPRDKDDSEIDTSEEPEDSNGYGIGTLRPLNKGEENSSKHGEP